MAKGKTIKQVMTKGLLEKDLTEFERRFELSSEEYYAQYLEGVVGDWISDQDAIWWAGTYECYSTMQQRFGQRGSMREIQISKLMSNPPPSQ